MANLLRVEQIADIIRAIGLHSGGASIGQVRDALLNPIALRTLQHRLRSLVVESRLIRDGEGRSVRYRLPRDELVDVPASFAAEDLPVLPSPEGRSIRRYVRRPPIARNPVGYDRRLLESYRPNVSTYLSVSERAHLAGVGTPPIAKQLAGTYAKRILGRLLIDLAWNSSRLEGNTYSLLDTKRLIEFGREAAGRAHVDAQMILNHKDAIEFLVGSASEIGLDRYTILNLHALLANNLLADASSAGRLRYIAVGIERSTFHPLEVPQLIEEVFDQILATAAAIRDPFEQAFFAMVHFPYLQPFDDANKRVSRLAANIPLIKGNLSPLSFVEVPEQLYTEAILGVYELGRIELLRDVFVWAYERSAARYAAVRQSLGEPDPFRFRYRDQLRDVVAAVIRARLGKAAAAAEVTRRSEMEIASDDRERFIAMAETELTGLHEGNFARYQIRPSEFATWREIWKTT